MVFQISIQPVWFGDRNYDCVYVLVISLETNPRPGKQYKCKVKKYSATYKKIQ